MDRSRDREPPRGGLEHPIGTVDSTGDVRGLHEVFTPSTYGRFRAQVPLSGRVRPPGDQLARIRSLGSSSRGLCLRDTAKIHDSTPYRAFWDRWFRHVVGSVQGVGSATGNRPCGRRREHLLGTADISCDVQGPDLVFKAPTPVSSDRMNRPARPTPRPPQPGPNHHPRRIHIDPPVGTREVGLGLVVDPAAVPAEQSSSRRSGG